MSFYTKIVRPLLFKINPENIHNFSISTGEKLGYIKPLASMLNSVYNVDDEKLVFKVCGLDFKNPVGLAAGYDKSGQAVPFLESLGFSHVEIGSVSAKSSIGNPKPRLFRLPEDNALVVHYGLQNDGAEVVASRLKKKNHKFPLGINIVKTNRGIDAKPDTEDDILNDYYASTMLLKNQADYITYNMSCPNTEMGRDYFADKKHIERFLKMLSETEITCPVFLKISPVGGLESIEKYLSAADGFNFVSGFVFNLPPGKMLPLKTARAVWANMPGAISGKPVEALINDSIGEMYKRMDRSKYRIIGVGGVFSANDVLTKIKQGASLVQLLTSLVYLGPGVVKQINKELLQFLNKEGFQNISEIVGSAHSL